MKGLSDGAIDDEDSDREQDETGLASIIAEILRAYQPGESIDAIFSPPNEAIDDDDENGEEESL